MSLTVYGWFDNQHVFCVFSPVREAVGVRRGGRVCQVGLDLEEPDKGWLAYPGKRSTRAERATAGSCMSLGAGVLRVPPPWFVRTVTGAFVDFLPR